MAARGKTESISEELAHCFHSSVIVGLAQMMGQNTLREHLDLDFRLGHQAIFTNWEYFLYLVFGKLKSWLLQHPMVFHPNQQAPSQARHSLFIMEPVLSEFVHFSSSPRSHFYKPINNSRLRLSCKFCLGPTDRYLKNCQAFWLGYFEVDYIEH